MLDRRSTLPDDRSAALRSQGVPVVLRLKPTSRFPTHVFADPPIIQIARDPEKPHFPPFPPGKLPEFWAPSTWPLFREALTERPCRLTGMHVPRSGRHTREETFVVIVKDAGPCEFNFVVSIDF